MKRIQYVFPRQHQSRPPLLLASMLAAGLMLTVASCTHLAPIGPVAPPPQPQHLRSPFVLQAMRIQPPASSGECPAGSTVVPEPPGPGPVQCARPTGTPVTITSAAISPVSSFQQRTPSGPRPGYGFTITLTAAEVPALIAVTTTAADAQGPLSITLAGKTWLLPIVLQPLTTRQLPPISLATKNQTLQLQRTLAASG